MKDCGPKGKMLSDEHSKKQIERLQSTNDALTQALDAAQARSGGGGMMPETEYPQLPSRTNFADTPAANKVAAQNVGLRAMAAPPPRPPAAAPGPGPQPPSGGAFNVASGMPDLSALDEAYRRQGMGG